MAEVSGGRVRGRPRLGCMDGVKVALGRCPYAHRNDFGGCATMRERSEILESPGTYVTERVSRGHFLLGRVFFWTALPCSGGYHLERGGMPFHDAVGIN